MTADYRTSVTPSYITRTSGGTQTQTRSFVDIQKKSLSVNATVSEALVILSNLYKVSLSVLSQ